MKNKKIYIIIAITFVLVSICAYIIFKAVNDDELTQTEATATTNEDTENSEIVETSTIDENQVLEADNNISEINENTETINTSATDSSSTTSTTNTNGSSKTQSSSITTQSETVSNTTIDTQESSQESTSIITEEVSSSTTIETTTSATTTENTEKYVQNDSMIATITNVINNNQTENMKLYGYEIVVDSEIVDITSQFTYTEKRVIDKISNKFGTIRIYARDYYKNGELLYTECFII